MQAKIAKIRCYPVKGLAAVELLEADINETGIPDDRRFGLARSSEAAKSWLSNDADKSWQVCHSLKEGGLLAELKISYQHHRSVLKLCHRKKNIEESLIDEEGRRRISAFVNTNLGLDCQIMDFAERPLWDWGKNASVSIVNLASLDTLSAAISEEIDPLRFRANFLIENLPAWAERDWIKGTKLRLGSAILEVSNDITRCAATKVNPENAAVDMNIPAGLVKHFGHSICGLALRVIETGNVKLDDRLEAVD